MEEIKNEKVEEQEEMENEVLDELDEEVKDSKMKKFVSGVKDKVKSVKPKHVLKGVAVVAGLVAAYTLGHRSSSDDDDDDNSVAESNYIELENNNTVDEPERTDE